MLETELHLTLSEEKTKLTHVNTGFDFLGFHLQRVKPEGRWVVHLRPSEKMVPRVKAAIKACTTNRQSHLDEVTRLRTLNHIVRGWCEYYKHTTLTSDLEEVSRYTWHRYLCWLRKKHPKKSRASLIKAKSRHILGRQRWVATLREGNQTLTVHQWLPSARELRRAKYRQKGRQGFPHPYLLDPAVPNEEEPRGESGPSEAVYRVMTPRDRPTAPLDWVERKLRVKLRDGFKCVRCGGQETLHIHHKRGLTSHRPKDLVTLCQQCHQAVHGQRARE